MTDKFRVRLKELREERAVSQKMLSIATGLCQVTVSHWETGKSSPNAEALLILCDFFGVTSDYLLGRSDEY